MNHQYLEYVRESLIAATADYSGNTKGQLEAFAEHPLVRITRYKRRRPRIVEVGNRKVVAYTDPVLSTETRSRRAPFPLIEPTTYSSSYWRRALLALDEHQKAWLLWNYSENIAFEYQVTITRWAWAEFKAQLGAKKIAWKTMERLKTLIWLAAQDAKNEISGRQTYPYQKLAELVGVTKSTWSEILLPHWLDMRAIFTTLDTAALYLVSRSRSQQKATNYVQYIANPN